MDVLDVNRIKNSPSFRELERKRSSFSWTLAAVMVAIYAVFIGLVAFDQGFMGQKMGDGPITYAFPIGLGVIAAAIILTGVYVFRANSEFDRLTREIVGQADSRRGTVGAASYGAVR